MDRSMTGSIISRLEETGATLLGPAGHGLENEAAGLVVSLIVRQVRC